MKISKKIVLAAAALPMIFGTASAYAFGGKHGGKDFGGKCGGMDRGVLRQLDLTDEQQDKLKELRDQMREERGGKGGKGGKRGRMMNAEQFAEMQENQTKIQDMMLDGTFTEEAAKELASAMVEKQVERRTEMLQKRYEMFQALELTEEQKTKLKELQAERAQKCQERIAERMSDSDS